MEYLVGWKNCGPEEDQWIKRREFIWTAEELIREYEMKNQRDDILPEMPEVTEVKEIPKTNVEIRLPQRTRQ